MTINTSTNKRLVVVVLVVVVVVVQLDLETIRYAYWACFLCGDLAGEIKYPGYTFLPVPSHLTSLGMR